MRNESLQSKARFLSALMKNTWNLAASEKLIAHYFLCLFFCFLAIPFARRLNAQTNTATYTSNVPFVCSIQNNQPEIAMTYAPENQFSAKLTANPTGNLTITSNSLIDISLDLISQTGLEIQSTSMFLIIDNAFSKLYSDNSLSYQAPSPRVPYSVSNSGTPLSTWLHAVVGVEPSDYQFVVRVTCLEHTE